MIQIVISNAISGQNEETEEAYDYLDTIKDQECRVSVLFGFKNNWLQENGISLSIENNN